MSPLVAAPAEPTESPEARTVASSRGGPTSPDAWPHTTRVMPWLLAGFLVMLWIVPFQDVRLPIQLPVDAKLDRFALAAVATVWVAGLLVAGRHGPRLRRNPVNLGIGAFVGVAVTSVLVNLEMLVTVDDFALALKKLALLLAYATFFLIAVSTLREAEVRSFCLLTVGLACMAALGTVWEYRTNTNLFYDTTAKLLPPGFSLDPQAPDSKFGRPAITGPTQHSLALSTMMAFAMPFAVVGLLQSRKRGRKIAYALATAVILAGAMATLRKTAAIVPSASLLILMVYWRRRMLRLAPLGIILVLVVQALSPGALASIRGQLQPDRLTASDSTQGRTEDYAAVAPDIKTRPTTGRGYGTYDSHKYRLLDNQYMALLIETGVMGVVAYVGMILAVLFAAHPVIRSNDPERAPPALAAAAAVGALLVTTMLFDVLAYPQAPYLFFFVAAIAVVCAGDSRPSGRTGPSRRPRVRRPAA